MITWRERTGESGTASLILEESTYDVVYNTHSSAPTTNSTTLITATVTSENSYRYIRISKDNPPSTTDFEIDAIGLIVASASDVTPALVGGIGTYTVTSDGELEISMSGGDGGGAATAGGSGASITATFNVIAGDVIRYVVGEGSDGSVGNSSGGAGSTGLFINNTLMMVAGGGAGGDNSVGGQGLGATATTTGGSGNGAGAGAGAGGAGGAGGSGHAAASGGGGGINSSGGDGDIDGDGIKNRIDLDADDDGIADIIEAGGIDTDENGRVDDATDTDIDGWSNVFDSDNGGSPLPTPNTDGDTVANYLDADSDGIIDIRESQTTVAFFPLLGNDIDNDGWDDQFDGDFDGGANGTPIVFSNNDGTGDPDYTDLDSDGDGFPDWQEWFDDDEDGDALNDLVARANTYEAANTNPGHYVNADDGDGDGIQNWAEDPDGDGTPNFLDPDNGLFRDFDGDGLVDLYDTDQNGSASIQPDADGDGEFDFRDIDNTVSLPVELLSFEIQKLFASVEINWVTVSEINNDYFIVQKLNPEREYNDLVKVDGAGNSNLQLSYQAIDDRPFKGENYYRLKQVDFDGTTTFTEPKMVLFNSFSSLKSEIELYPNPGNG